MTFWSHFFGKSQKPHAYRKKLNSALVTGASGSSLNTWKDREEVEKPLDLKKDVKHYYYCLLASLKSPSYSIAI